MVQRLVLVVLAAGCLCAALVRAQPGDHDAELKELRSTLEELRAARKEQASELSTLKSRLVTAERQLQARRDSPKVAFTASLGGNGLQSTKHSKRLIFKDVLTNVGNAYNPETGVFKVPMRGVYYIRFTANSPTDGVMSAVLYRQGSVALIVHEQPSGQGSDTASNGATFLLEEGEELHMELWANTQIWDNSNHHSTFSGFLLFPMPADRGDKASQLPDLRSMLRELKADREAQAEELSTLNTRLMAAEKQLQKSRVAFTASLGGNGLQSTKHSKRLIFKDVLTNVGNAYNPETGVFKVPMRGVYYIRFTANSPTDGVMSAVLYRQGSVALIVHEQPSGQGSDTASNGATFLLEEGEELHMELWANTQIWDNSNHHSTFSGFLLSPM